MDEKVEEGADGVEDTHADAVCDDEQEETRSAQHATHGTQEFRRGGGPALRERDGLQTDVCTVIDV